MKIESYEDICPCCGGASSEHWGEDSTCYIMCGICRNHGKVDWIDKIKNPDLVELINSRKKLFKKLIKNERNKNRRL